jgi:hypothetical protein
MSSAIFLKKIGSGMHSDPKFGWRGGGVSYIDAREKRFQNTIPACALLRKNFSNNILACSVTKISMENHGGMIVTGETLDLSTSALWQSYQQSHPVTKQVELAKQMINCAV